MNCTRIWWLKFYTRSSSLDLVPRPCGRKNSLVIIVCTCAAFTSFSGNPATPYTHCIFSCETYSASRSRRKRVAMSFKDVWKFVLLKVDKATLSLKAYPVCPYQLSLLSRFSKIYRTFSRNKQNLNQKSW